MANTYTWSFPTLTAYPQAEGQTDVVYTEHWTLTGTDGNGHTGSVYATVSGGSGTPTLSANAELA